MLKILYDLQNYINSFMDSKGKFVLELEDLRSLTDLGFLVDLTTFLNKFNMHLQGENKLICAMLQTYQLFKMKLKLWQTLIMANNFMHFYTSAKHTLL